MSRPYNFSPGPATLPESVLQQAAAEMLDWHGSGMSVMEMSHRGRDYGLIIEQCEADLRALLAIPLHYRVLFLQGGAQAQNAVLPLNLAALKPQRQMDYVVTGSWSRVALAYGGAQKNIGPAGLTLVVLREDLLGHALPICPSVFDYRLQANNQSMLNTPPTYAIYIAGLTLQWIKAQREGDLTGLAAVEARNIAKAQLLYDCIDGSQLYENRVDPACRSRMNVPFFLRDESRNAAFLAGAAERGLLQLKGHKMVGGMRASLYNAMPLAGVQALVEWLREFERQS